MCLKSPIAYVRLDQHEQIFKEIGIPIITQVEVEIKQDDDMNLDVNGSEGAESDVQNKMEFEPITCEQNDYLNLDRNTFKGASQNSDGHELLVLEPVTCKPDVDLNVNVNDSEEASVHEGVHKTTTLEQVTCKQDEGLNSDPNGSEGALLNSDEQKTVIERVKCKQDDDLNLNVNVNAAVSESPNIDKPKMPEFKISGIKQEPERREIDLDNDGNDTTNEALVVCPKRKAEQETEVKEEVESKRPKQSENIYS